MNFIVGLKEKDNRKALYAALIFMMLMLLFFLLVSMNEPDPPLKEKVIEVEIEFGGEPGGGSPRSESSETITNTVTESAQDIETQEESSVQQNTAQGTNANSNNTQEEQPDKVDSELGFKPGGNKGTNGEDGEDDKQGGGFKDGDKGDGPKGFGAKTNLNRKVANYGGITAQSQQEGKVAIDIWVNDKGEVVKVKYNPSNSNTASDYLIGLAKKWAYTMAYEKSLGSPTQFVGHQVFTFKKQ
tara:strand:+ start:1905 stop:2630 length:726 start_codon:yes stop_codon:yes gene_type:complete